MHTICADEKWPRAINVEAFGYESTGTHVSLLNEDRQVVIEIQKVKEVYSSTGGLYQNLSTNATNTNVETGSEDNPIIGKWLTLRFRGEDKGHTYPT